MILMSNGGNSNGNSDLSISVSQRGLLSNEKTPKFGFPGKLKLPKFNYSENLPSPSAKFRELAKERDEISRSVPSTSSNGFKKRFNGILARKIDWTSMRGICQEWVKKPFNMALLLWIVCVAVSGAILFLVMTGMLNKALTKKSQRDAWFEVNNQILNALFTLMCLYQHPKRFHYLVMLCRWNPKDVSALRKIYCKDGTYKPHEWAHIMVVVLLLHLNCIAQYALCGLNLGYRRSQRPAMGVGICLAVAIAAPAIAGVYSIMSPLGKEYDSDTDEEAQDQVLAGRESLEKRFSFASRNEQRIVEYAPEWSGGLFDIWDDIVVAYLSLFCSFCVFGWNMERLGFGNMYVHISTFLLFCLAPFFIFNLAAINIDNEAVREALGFTGVVLCVFGLLYGGFWRIQMRKRFNLPGNNWCCGKPAIADCALWLCCCWCTLAQEVRTADFYDTVEDKFCRKHDSQNARQSLSPLSREDGAAYSRYNSNSPFWSPTRSNTGTGKSTGPSKLSKTYFSPDRQIPKVDEEPSQKIIDIMSPPIPSIIQRDDIIHQNIIRS